MPLPIMLMIISAIVFIGCAVVDACGLHWPTSRYIGDIEMTGFDQRCSKRPVLSALSYLAFIGFVASYLWKLSV